MIKLAFTGDILSYQNQNVLILEKYGSYDYMTVFENVTHMFDGTDYVIGSLETVVTDKQKYTFSPISFNSPSQILQSLRRAGFNLLTTANNHCLDRGIVGLDDTIYNIKKNGLHSTGTRSSESDSPFFVFNVGETKIAVLSYTYDTNPDANGVQLNSRDLFRVNLTKEQMRIVQTDDIVKLFLHRIKKIVKGLIRKRTVEYYAGPVIDCVSDQEISNPKNASFLQKLRNDIDIAKEQADYVFFCLHSGGQFNDKVGNYTNYLIDEIAKCKVNAIVCNHTHCILPVSSLCNTLVAYSLGNFCFTPFEGYYVDGVYADYSSILYVTIDEKKKTIIPSVSFVKNVVGDDGITRVFSLFDLIQNADDMKKKKQLLKDLKAIINRAGIKLEEGEKLVQKEYSFNHIYCYAS